MARCTFGRDSRVGERGWRGKFSAEKGGGRKIVPVRKVPESVAQDQ